MTYARVLGTGSYLPVTCVTNQELATRVDTTDSWIRERTGIEARHIAEPHETASFMGEKAAQRALEAAQLSPTDIELIIVATCTPDQMFPSTACLVQKQLGAPNGIPAFDVSAACAGFSYALSIADQFIRTGFVKTALVIGSETMSRIVDWNDRKTCVLFGDGAGAVVLGRSDQPGIHTTYLHADGRFNEILSLPNTIAVPASTPYLQMEGKEVFKFAVKALGDIVEECLEATQIPASAIDWLIPHQANVRIIEATAKRLNLSMDHVILTIAQQGNTSSASIPLALDAGIREGRIQRGQKLLLEGIGGGMAWGAALITY